MNEQEILKIIEGNYDHIYQLKNSFVFGWESDYFGITKGTGYAYEIEVKISKSDFQADFKHKTFKHRCLSNSGCELITFPSKEATRYGQTDETTMNRIGQTIPVYDYIPQGYCQLIIKKNITPNRFFYAVPEELVEKIIDLVPKYAGLISVSKIGLKEVKPAPLLHKRKSFEQLSGILLDKFYYAYKNKVNEITQLRRDIHIEKYYYEPEEFQEKVSHTQLSIF